MHTTKHYLNVAQQTEQALLLLCLKTIYHSKELRKETSVVCFEILYRTFFEAAEQRHENLNRHSRPPNRISNLGPPECEAGMLITIPRRSFQLFSFQLKSLLCLF